MPDVSLGLVLVVASGSVFGPLSGWLAGQRTRNVALWAIFGILLGPIAPGLLIAAPPGRCAACRWPVAGWNATCASCGADVRTGAPAEGTAPTLAEPASVAEPDPAPVAARRGARRVREAAPASPEPASEPSTARARRGRPATAPLPATAARREAPAWTDDPVLTHHEWTPAVSATRLGNRPTELGPAPQPTPQPTDGSGEHADTSLAVLGSGVYVGGNRGGILAGNRYLIARVAGELQILGPVHIDPGAVADRVPLDAIEAFVLEGRLVIGGRDAKSDITMAFVGVSQQREGDIVAALARPESAASAS